jgi:copper resistance protein D
MIDGLWLAARAAAYLLVLQATGSLIFLAMFGRRTGAAQPRLARTARRVACGALIVCLGQLLLEPAYMAGEAVGMLDSQLWQVLLQTGAVWVLGLRAAAMACLLVALGRASPARMPAAVCVCAVLASFLISGHTVNAPARWLLAPLLALHVLAAAFWLGALWPLRQLASRMEPALLAALLRDFSRLALRLVPLLGLAGIAMACVLLPGIAALATPYGFLLCAKALLFSGLLGLAAFNRLRLTPVLAAGSRGALRVLRRCLTIEYALVVLVLCLTAALTGAYSPPGH